MRSARVGGISDPGSDKTLNAFLSPRRFLLAPIDEIWTAAALLHSAADAHLAGDASSASRLIREADIPAIAAWTERIWWKIDPEIHRHRPVAGTPPTLSDAEKPRPQMPNAAMCRELRTRDGHFCRFCGIPVVDKAIRTRIRAIYLEELRWGASNPTQHAAFQCMWLQYDHLLPNSRGGRTTIENLIITCAPCNFGRGERTSEEVGLIDPSTAPAHDRRGMESWDGLERFR